MSIDSPLSPRSKRFRGAKTEEWGFPRFTRLKNGARAKIRCPRPSFRAGRTRKTPFFALCSTETLVTQATVYYVSSDSLDSLLFCHLLFSSSISRHELCLWSRTQHLWIINDHEDSKAPRARLSFLTLLACFTVYAKVFSYWTRLSSLFWLCQNTGRKRRRERRRKSGRSLANQVGEK